MLMLRNRFVSAALVAGALAVFGQAAHAQTSLTPGNTVNTTPAIGALGGVQQGTTQTATFTESVGAPFLLRGTLYSAVFLRAGTLDFYYQVVLAPASTTALDQFSIASFGTSLTSVGQTTDNVDGGGPMTAGGTLSANANRNFNGTGVFFNFANFASGSTSATQIVSTNATTYSLTGGAGFSGSGTVAQSIGPVIAVGSVGGAPEPGSLVLMGTGLMSAAGMVVRRRRIAKK